MIRVIIGGILGGILIFVWGAVMHMATPLGEAGLKSVPNEDAVVRSLKENFREPGLYVFPGIEMGKGSTEQQAAWQAKYTAGPTGLINIHPAGMPSIGPKLLGFELLTNIIIALLAAVIVYFSAASFAQRIFLVTLLGVIGWVSISLSYWNWYGYPTAYIAAEGVEQVGGFLLCGILLAIVVRPRTSTT